MERLDNIADKAYKNYDNSLKEKPVKRSRNGLAKNDHSGNKKKRIARKLYIREKISKEKLSSNKVNHRTDKFRSLSQKDQWVENSISEYYDENYQAHLNWLKEFISCRDCKNRYHPTERCWSCYYGENDHSYNLSNYDDDNWNNCPYYYDSDY